MTAAETPQKDRTEYGGRCKTVRLIAQETNAVKTRILEFKTPC